jgi:hypothetical protein
MRATLAVSAALATLGACQSGQTPSQTAQSQGGERPAQAPARPGGHEPTQKAPRPDSAQAARDPATGAPSSPSGPPSDRAAVATPAVLTSAKLEACRAAAARVAGLPRTKRTVALLEGCQPCGDWGPLLGWDIPVADGGPTRAAIEQGLAACNAFCEPTAKQRFFATLDSARTQETRTPWRILGEVCKAGVSALPDARFMGAPYFALDRVARAIGDAALLAPLELPLPAISLSGFGLELPTAPMLEPDAGPATLTVDASQFLLGSLPVAKLSPTGVQVSGDYPGTSIAPRALAAALARHAPAGRPIALLAPRQLPATRIIDAVTAAGGHELRLAAADLELRGWIIPATVPIALAVKAHGRGGVRLTLDDTAVDAIKAAKATPRAQLARAPVTIAVDGTATVASLANLLGALGYFDVKAVVLVNAAARRTGARP